MSYDKRIPIRLTSDQLRLIDEATEKSYHSKRSDWMRAALMAAVENQLYPERQARRLQRFVKKDNGQCQKDGDEN